MISNYKFQVPNYKENKGFTIVELIVVMTVFSFVIGAAIGIFISIIQHQKKVLAEQQLLNQISYVEEYMSKALRAAKTAEDDTCIPSGYIYLLTRHNGTIYNGIKFINQSNSNVCQEIFLDADDNILKERKEDDSLVNLISTDLQINFVRFSVNGLDGSVIGQHCPGTADQCGGACPNLCGTSNMDDVQPRATILLNVKIAGDCPTCNRIIQTTVSQRNLNVNNGQR